MLKSWLLSRHKRHKGHKGEAQNKKAKTGH